MELIKIGDIIFNMAQVTTIEAPSAEELVAHFSGETISQRTAYHFRGSEKGLLEEWLAGKVQDLTGSSEPDA
jgi:hypothetical protein